MSENPITTDTEAVFHAGFVAAQHNSILIDAPNPISVLIPDGYSHLLIDPYDEYEKTLPYPIHKKTIDNVACVDSFIRLVNRHKTSATTIWADPANNKITAIIDDHESVENSGNAGWRNQIVNLNLRHSPEWTTWHQYNNLPVAQKFFAEFIEDNALDVHTPDGAELLQIVSSFKATKATDFRQSIRLENGDIQFQYDTTTTAKAKNGSVTIPDTFTLRLQPFDLSEIYKVGARFRYKVDEGKLSMWYQLVKPERIERDAFNTILETVQKEFDGVVYVK